MATVSIGITRDNGIHINASAEVDDASVIDMAGMIGAMIFDASYAEGSSFDLSGGSPG